MKAIDRPFVWTTQDGEELTAAQMKTYHLFFAVRMIFNHTAPPAYQIPGCRRHSGPETWPRWYRRAALAAFLGELAGRPRRELRPWMIEQLLAMWRACLAMEIQGLPECKPKELTAGRGCATLIPPCNQTD